MPLFTMITGTVLILVGALGYYLYTTTTVLIPAILGLIIFLLGILSKKELGEESVFMPQLWSSFWA